MNKLIFRLLLLILIFSSQFTFAQSNDPILDSLQTLFDKETNQSEKVQLLLNMADQARITLPLSYAETYIQQASDLAKAAKDETLFANVLTEKGKLQAIKGDYAQSIKHLEKALAIHKKIGNKVKTINTLNGLGIVNKELGNYIKSIQYLEQAVGYFSDDIPPSNKGSILLNLSVSYGSINNYELSYEKLFEGLKYCEEAGDIQRMGTAYANLGIIYKRQNDFDNAIKYWNKSLEMLKEIGYLEAQVNVYSNLANVYDIKKEYDKALEAQLKSVELSEQTNARQTIFFAKAHAVRNYISVKNYDKAAQFLKEISPYVDSVRLYEQSIFYNHSAEYYLATKQYDKGISMALKGYDIVKKNGKHDDLAAILTTLDLLYKAKGDYKSAHYYLKEYMIVSDSMTSESNLQEISNQRIQFELDKERATYDLEKKALENSLRTQRTIRWAAIIVALLIGVIAFISYQNYQRQRQARQKEALYSKELEAKNQQLKEVDVAKTQFFANISHELKTPLTLIINPLQKVLKSKKLNDKNQYLVQQAEQNSLQLMDLVFQILELTKFENNKTNVHNTTLHFRKTIEKLHADFESLAVSRNIDFNLKYEANPDLHLEIDKYKFTTVVKNIISNAIKFTPDHGTVDFVAKELPETIQIQIADTGRGIHEKDLPHIFDRYYQSSISGDIMEGGTGIGLAICKEYTELMNGNIQVKSIYKKGTTFIIELPKIVGEPSDTLIENQTIAPVFPLNKPTHQAHLPTILVVEDNQSMQEYLNFILQPNFNVIIAPHGKVALNILKQQPETQTIDLIVSDLMMPEMNGYELVTALKTDAQLATIPVIMLTALNTTDEKLKALRVGIDDYIVKPFVDEELLARIDNLITNAEERKNYKRQVIIENIETKEINPKNDLTSEKDNVEVHSDDLEWLTQFEQIVKDNYQNANFKIDQYTSELLISRTKMYQKVKLLTGLTPKSYINEVRFREARKLIENQPNLTVKMIAYKVGFRDEKYFARNFKKRFGSNPSEYLVG